MGESQGVATCKIGPYPQANLAKFKNLFWGKVLEGFWGRKNWIKNRVLHPVFFYSKKRSTSSAHDFPASAQSVD
ncbi:hypothetical protein, partial [Klebsiella variicola]|uniref:hypothetical protein n=1 Tax=Klebsiella variicola TaxID=244366 RepID=UPI0022DFCBBF